MGLAFFKFTSQDAWVWGQEVIPVTEHSTLLWVLESLSPTTLKWGDNNDYNSLNIIWHAKIKSFQATSSVVSS